MDALLVFGCRLVSGVPICEEGQPGEFRRLATGSGRIPSAPEAAEEGEQGRGIP
jgi:hypothetical protein